MEMFSSKIAVAICPKCGRQIRVQAHAVKPKMILTCKCGEKIEVAPDPKVVQDSIRVMNSNDYRVNQIIKKIESQKPYDLDFGLGAEALSKIAKSLTDVLAGRKKGDHVTAVRNLAGLAKLAIPNSIDGLTVALSDPNKQVRYNAALALHMRGKDGDQIIKANLDDLATKGFTEAFNAINEYEKVKKWAIETAKKYPKNTLEVYNDNWNLRDDELHQMALELKALGFWVSDGSRHPGALNLYRGFWIRADDQSTQKAA